MEIRPIFGSLRKHRIPASLLVLEVALACMVFCNAVFMIGQRVALLHMPNAMDESGVVTMSVQGTDPAAARSDVPRNLATLRSLPGVRAVAAMSAVPFGHSHGIYCFYTQPARKGRHECAAVYLASQGVSEALGLHLLQGRYFRGDEYAAGGFTSQLVPKGHVIMLPAAMAHALWPDGHATGQQIWLGDDRAYTVVGVIGNIARSGSPAQAQKFGQGYNTVLFPSAPDSALYEYVVRTTPANREHVLHAAKAKLHALAPNAVVKGSTFAQRRADTFAGTRSMVVVLVLVCVIMLAVTAFGIVGLTSFWVRQRRRQIGIRRAVGATRGNILAYFQTENFILSTVGVVLGVILAFGANLYLMQSYQLSRMPWYYLPASAIALWLLGQLAVLGPALRASRVPPVVATRSV